MGQSPMLPIMTNADDYRDTHRDLVLGCCRGDRQAQAALYRHYARPMYNLAIRMLGNMHDAEDVLQLAFVDIFRRIDTFKFQSSIGAWIKRIVVNRCIDHLKKQRLLTQELQPQHHLVEEDSNEEADPAYTVEGIKKAVEQLSDGYRVVLSLYLFEGYDHEEIASILEITPSTSKSQYHRAKKRLQDILRQTAQ